MDKKDLNLKKLEKAIGGVLDSIPLCSTLSPSEVSDLLTEAWQMKVIRHYTKQKVIDELSEKVRPVQRRELASVIDAYWDYLT